jgi:hypothetical protein
MASPYRPLERAAQIVDMQLDGPARVFAILDGQGIDDQRRHAREAIPVAAHAVLQGGHRVIGTSRGVPFALLD